MTRDWVNEGAEPDDAPSGRCNGPAYPNAHGCGRFARDAMCERCQEETRQYWHDRAEQIAYEEASMAEYARQEAEYIRAEMAAHPPMVTACDWCGFTGMCSWQMPGYICIDRALCDARCLEAHELETGFRAAQAWGKAEC